MEGMMGDFRMGALAQALMGMVGGGGSSQAPYMGMQGYGPNYFSYQPGLTDALRQMLVPGSQRQSPMTMLPSDWQRVLQYSRERSNVQSQYNAYSPLLAGIAQKVGGVFGVDKDQVNAMMQSSMGRILSYGWNMTMGSALGGDSAARGQVSVSLMDSMRGMYFGRERGLSGYGVTAEESKNITQNLLNLTYRKPDLGLFQKGPFDLRQMGEIARMGGDYGLFTGANVGDITNRVQGFAKTIELGMAVYQEFDKEKVLENIMQLTQGSVPLTNTTQIQDVLHRVAATARAANVSVQAMQKIISEGASLYRQVGITGPSGAIATMQTATFSRALGSQFGGMSPILSQQQIARAGGAEGVRAIMQSALIGFQGSSYFQNMAAAVTMGGVDINAFRQGTAGVGDISPVLDKRAKEIQARTKMSYEQSYIAARDEFESNKQKRTSEFMEKMEGGPGGLEAFQMAAAAQLSEIDKYNVEYVGLVSRLVGGEKLNQEQKDVIKNKYARHMIEREGMDEAMAQARASTFVEIFDPAKKKAFDEERLRERREIVKEQWNMHYRSVSGPLERVMQQYEKFGDSSTIGDLLKAALPEVEQSMLSAAGFDYRAMSATDVARQFSDAASWLGTENDQTVYYGMSRIQGSKKLSRRSVFGPDGLYGQLQDAVKGKGLLSKDQAIADLSSQLEVQASPDEVAQSFKDFFATEDATIENFYKWAEKHDNSAHKQKSQELRNTSKGRQLYFSLLKELDSEDFNMITKTMMDLEELRKLHPEAFTASGSDNELMREVQKYFNGESYNEEMLKKIGITKPRDEFVKNVLEQSQAHREDLKAEAKTQRETSMQSVKANRTALYKSLYEGGTQLDEGHETRTLALLGFESQDQASEFINNALTKFYKGDIEGYQKDLLDRALSQDALFKGFDPKQLEDITASLSVMLGKKLVPGTDIEVGGRFGGLKLDTSEGGQALKALIEKFAEEDKQVPDILKDMMSTFSNIGDKIVEVLNRILTTLGLKPETSPKNASQRTDTPGSAIERG